MSDEDKLRKLDIHESVQIADYLHVTRVIGGFMYEYWDQHEDVCASAVFVPYKILPNSSTISKHYNLDEVFDRMAMRARAENFVEWLINHFYVQTVPAGSELQWAFKNLELGIESIGTQEAYDLYMKQKSEQ